MAIDDNIVIDRTSEQLINAIDITDGASATGENSTALGNNSEAAGDGSVAIGLLAETTDSGDIAVGMSAKAEDGGNAIGTGAEASGNVSIAIGQFAIATGSNAVQIGQGTNSVANTIKFKNTTILDATGKIPFSALQSGEVVGLAVNSNNHLIVTYADGTTADFGAIGGGGGTSDYTQLTNKPNVNGTTLTGNKTSADLALQDRTIVTGTDSKDYYVQFGMSNGKPVLNLTEVTNE